MKKIIRISIAVIMMITMATTSVLPCTAVRDSLGQNQILASTPLLNSNGHLTEPGYCFHNYYIYDRSAIKSSPLTIKEWNFYQISNGRYCLQAMIADVSYGGTSSVTLFDMETGEMYTTSTISLLTFGRYGVNDTNAMAPSVISKHKKNYNLDIVTADGYKTIKFNGKSNDKDFTVDVRLDMFPDHESLTFAVPLKKNDKTKFYLDQKINCMPVSGTVKVGDLTVTFDPEDTFGILDWGRGAWPYHSNWYWGNGSQRLENGDVFGFEIGWGFGDENICTENTLFLNGKAYKIGKITLDKGESNWRDESDWMDVEWKFTSDDDSFEMTMTPIHDNFTRSRVLFIGNWCHEVFGKFNGTVRIDGKTIEIHDMVAFCEEADNLY